jgi:hypothetical protein
LAFLQQTSGKELLVGMGLEPMGLFPLSVDMYLQGDGSMGLGVGTSYPLGSTPSGCTSDLLLLIYSRAIWLLAWALRFLSHTSFLPTTIWCVPSALRERPCSV